MNDPLQKLSDPTLRAIAESEDVETPLDVIVELSLPATAAPPAHVQNPRKPRPTPPRATEAHSETYDPHTREMDQLERELNRIGSVTTPHRLALAQAFAVKLTPEQLRAVARLPGVGVIRPNRTHRRTAPK